MCDAKRPEAPSVTSVASGCETISACITETRFSSFAFGIYIFSPTTSYSRLLRLFHGNCSRKQDVIFEVNVLVQIGLEFRQSPVASPIAHAIGKRNFPAELKSVDLLQQTVWRRRNGEKS